MAKRVWIPLGALALVSVSVVARLALTPPETVSPAVRELNERLLKDDRLTPPTPDASPEVKRSYEAALQGIAEGRDPLQAASRQADAAFQARLEERKRAAAERKEQEKKKAEERRRMHEARRAEAQRRRDEAFPGPRPELPPDDPFRQPPLPRTPSPERR